MPSGLDIDHTRTLNGTMSAHAKHLIISTGRSDWTSRIEDEKDTAGWGKFTADIKALLGRHGEFHDPFNNILISLSSFTPRDTRQPDVNVPAQPEVDAVLFPSFQHFRKLKVDAASDSLKKFIRYALLPNPENLNSMYNDLPESEKRAKTRDPAAGKFISRADVCAPTILICSHGQRDSRCGILGPLLHKEFTQYIEEHYPRLQPQTHIFANELLSGHDAEEPRSELRSTSLSSSTNGEGALNINIGMISHIGGHKWAGNVILYIPPDFTRPASTYSSVSPPVPHPLAGKGVWYGRVEPRHIQGIVEQTLLRGKVIQELFRGATSQTDGILKR
ncbi:uncharacterized protein Z518_00345 [Rhinocladiella mackenziei CBS 650.93]|uniref:Altered inheritance of mitochondria protein 32 n=1 Tax=Rhinocladiella mackenziei CBS 650.93 TaxID=1442369 RepID=A0A0D2J0Q3_9EURO|nr:uncharacterized protein Z518_00345 [Rhinocladiella mackenziei CBS 650.93]KIX09266.1 hypothetical protein Z518_00345 [Rhinocladiella mackenziei CBS 650.93]